MATFLVTVPIAGHIVMEIEAESEDAAIEKAIDNATLDDLEDWEVLRQFNAGNVCYCPHPWQAEAQNLDVDEHELDNEEE